MQLCAPTRLANCWLLRQRSKNAIREQNRVEQITLEGEKAILQIRQRLTQAVANETDDRVKQQLYNTAQLDIERERLRTATQLQEVERDITSEKEAQVAAMLEAMGFVQTGPGSARSITGRSNERQQQLRMSWSSEPKELKTLLGSVKS